MTMTAGAEANASGRFLEDTIERIFAERRVPIFCFSEDQNNGNLFHDQRLIKRVPYINVAAEESISEFVYKQDSRLLELRIECKWQQGPGSADERLYCLVENAIEAMPESNIWLVVEGGGHRAGHVRYLRAKISRVTHKNIRMFNLVQARIAIKRLVGDGLA